MDNKTAGQIHFEFENIGYGLFWSEQTAETKEWHERIADAVIAHAKPQIEAEARAKAILSAANNPIAYRNLLARSKSQYKRLVAQGANVLPPIGRGEQND